MLKKINFWKYQGLGNDFILIDKRSIQSFTVTPKHIQALCDRKKGIGADGILFISEDRGSEGVDAALHVMNSDGSFAEICGNGLRCAMLHLYEYDLKNQKDIILETGVGPRQCTLVEHLRDGVAIIEVEMGSPKLEKRDIPVKGQGVMVEESLDIGDRNFTITGVNMGNPHAVTFDEHSADDVVHFGQILEKHDLFPAGVNVGFASMKTPEQIDLTVWERGAGLTGACGSGACATAVAACITKRAVYEQPLNIVQPGGELTITVRKNGPVIMKGKAQRVFFGEVDLSLLE